MVNKTASLFHAASHKSTIMPKLGDLVTCCTQSDM